MATHTTKLILRTFQGLLIVGGISIVCSNGAIGKRPTPNVQRPINRNAEFDRGVNAALDATLIAVSDAREQHRRPTWAEIDKEACRRLNVKRDDWFMKVVVAK